MPSFCQYCGREKSPSAQLCTWCYRSGSTHYGVEYIDEPVEERPPPILVAKKKKKRPLNL